MGYPPRHPVTLRRRARVLCVAACCIVGCDGADVISGTPQPTPQYRGGSRLKARIIDGGDGAERFLQWYDTQLDTTCDFGLAEDGRMRCLPDAAGVDYLDAACTQLAAMARPSCAPARYAQEVVEGSEGCFDDPPPRRRIYAITATPLPVSWLDESPPTILTYTRDDDGSCVAVEVTDATGALALEALAPEQFVEARFDVETRGEALAVVRLSTPDGASGVHAFYDLGREHLCAPIDAGGEGWCLWGVTQVTAHFFADASCSNPVASRGACAAPPQVAIVDAASDACDPPSVRLHDVGPETAAYWLDGSCVAVEGIFYRVGAALEEGAFERVPGAEVGGRLTVRKWMNGGVPAADAGYYFYDRDLGIACIPRVIGGEQRCLPVQESVAVYSYADPACSQPLHASAHALCGWPEHVLLSHKDSCGLPMIEEVRPVMGTHEGAFYHLGDSGCVSAGEGNAALLGPPIDPSSFAALSTELR